MQGVLDALVKRVLLCAHPVGCVYMSLEATSPAVLFGGTWERIAQGRMLLGMGAIEENHNSYWGTVTPGEVNPGYAGEMGGEAWHGLTVNEMPSHYHHCPVPFNSTGNNRAVSGSWMDSAPAADDSQSKSSSTGGNEAHNNMPPYYSVFMWRRTA